MVVPATLRLHLDPAKAHFSDETRLEFESIAPKRSALSKKTESAQSDHPDMEAASKRSMWSSVISLKTAWICSMLLILSVQLWMLNQTQHLATSQALLRVNLPNLREAETPKEIVEGAEQRSENITADASVPVGEEDIPRAMDLALKYKYNETCVKLRPHHLEKLFIKPDLCISRIRLRQILIDLVLTASTVFTEHNITHFLDSGSLLGAHRHKSVIPYDIDSDMAIDAAGYEKIKRTPIQFPPEYYMQVFGSDVHPKGTRYIELPVRVIHRESALYLDVFVYNDSVDKDGNEWTGPLPAGAFINCAKCPKLEATRWELKLPRNWIYPLRDCRFAKHTLKCPAETEKYLEYMFGPMYMQPVEHKAGTFTPPSEKCLGNLATRRFDRDDGSGGHGAPGRARDARRGRHARRAGAAGKRHEEPRRAAVAVAAALAARVSRAGRGGALAQRHRRVRVCRTVVAGIILAAVYRFVHRLGERLEKRRQQRLGGSQKTQDDTKTTTAITRRASIAASVLGVLCINPSSRSAVISLLSTNTASLWFRNYLAKHPELARLAPLELLVFMLSGGWIMYSGFFHPESYEPSHLKLIMKYTLVSPEGAGRLQEQYREGLNPSTCNLRHPGLECNEYLFPGFMKRVVALGYRVYLPVHLTSWLISLRYPKVRATPLPEMLAKFLTKLTRSAMYFIGFIGIGWTVSCHTSSIGDRSVAWRKLQFLFCGTLPALSILFEAPARRRPIGVILVSYALVSLGSVVTRRMRWLQQGSGPIRTLLDVALFTGAVTYTLPAMLQGNAILRRMLLGSSKAAATGKEKKKAQPHAEAARAPLIDCW